MNSLCSVWLSFNGVSFHLMIIIGATGVVIDGFTTDGHDEICDDSHKIELASSLSGLHSTRNNVLLCRR